MKILVVDDMRTVHAYLRGMLGGFAGVAITDVFNGAEALERLAQDPSFDLVLLDWEMPVLDGPATLAQIKKMPVIARVIMMTTKNKPEEISRMLELGADDYLMKPFTLDILLAKVEMVCGKALDNAA